MSIERFDDLSSEVLSNPEARVAAHENDLRRVLAETFETVRSREGISVRQLAESMGTSLSQVQRVLHMELGGTLTLKTICRAADALDVAVKLTIGRGRSLDLESPHLESIRWKKMGNVSVGNQPQPRPSGYPRSNRFPKWVDAKKIERCA